MSEKPHQRNWMKKYTQEELRQAERFDAAALPIWREALLGVDWLSLRASPVYRGIGVPTGDGSAVVLVPGFLGSDRYLADLHGWLRRIGYQAYLSGIGRNFDCPNILCNRLQETIARANEESGGRAHVIGHSLGGVLARSAAGQWPRMVGSVITMASPFRGVRAHPFLLEAARLVRGRIIARRVPEVLPDCYTGYCGCAFLQALRTPLPDAMPQTAIYTKTDGVVDWHRCVTENPALDIEVPGTHAGLVFNPQVYRHIAAALARAAKPRARRRPVSGANPDRTPRAGSPA